MFSKRHVNITIRIHELIAVFHIRDVLVGIRIQIPDLYHWITDPDLDSEANNIILLITYSKYMNINQSSKITSLPEVTKL
jgi:hypothetical protein